MNVHSLFIRVHRPMKIIRQWPIVITHDYNNYLRSARGEKSERILSTGIMTPRGSRRISIRVFRWRDQRVQKISRVIACIFQARNNTVVGWWEEGRRVARTVILRDSSDNRANDPLSGAIRVLHNHYRYYYQLKRVSRSVSA